MNTSDVNRLKQLLRDFHQFVQKSEDFGPASKIFYTEAIEDVEKGIHLVKPSSEDFEFEAISEYDGNDSFTISAESFEDAQIAALNELGWTVYKHEE